MIVIVIDIMRIWRMSREKSRVYTDRQPEVLPEVQSEVQPEVQLEI